MAKSVKRVRRSPDEARRLILDAAREAIARTGPDGLRLHDIAVAAGVSHPLILHHFGSRAGLVRALTREAIAELRDKLIAAMAEPDHSPEELISRVFDGFREGLGQRLAWLATVDPNGDQGGSTMVQLEFAERVHARRVAMAPPDTPIPLEDSQFLVHLIAIAALGDAIYGAQFRRSAGLPEARETNRRFRAWLAALIRARSARLDRPPIAD